MRHVQTSRRFTARALCVALLIGQPYASANEQEDAEKELEALSRELNALDSWVSDAERERMQEQRELRRLDKRVEELERTMRASRLLILDQDAAISELEAESALLRAQVQRQGDILARLGMSYRRLSGRRYAMLLFELGSAREVDRVMYYTQIFRDHYLERLQDQVRTLADYQDIRKKLEESLLREDQLQSDFNARKEEVLAEKRERTRYIASLESELLSREQRRTELVQSAQRIKDLLMRLRSRLSMGSGEDFVEQRGKLPWPTGGYLLHRYGAARADTNITWQGIFIASEPQQEIRAVHGGITIYQDWLNGLGNVLVVAHGDQHMSLYAQADSFYKSVNDPVEGGEVVGVTGASGGARQSGVYFEIRVDGRPENPQQWLVER